VARCHSAFSLSIRIPQLYFLLRLVDFRLVDRREVVFRLDALREDDLRLGTFAPERRASDSPMAMACLRLLALFPDRPLFNLPLLYSCIARPTFFFEPALYFGMVAPFAVHLRRRRDTCCNGASLARWIAHYLCPGGVLALSLCRDSQAEA
jgi:hypothetical protein